MEINNVARFNICHGKGNSFFFRFRLWEKGCNGRNNLSPKRLSGRFWILSMGGGGQYAFSNVRRNMAEILQFCNLLHLLPKNFKWRKLLDSYRHQLFHISNSSDRNRTMFLMCICSKSIRKIKKNNAMTNDVCVILKSISIINY